MDRYAVGRAVDYLLGDHQVVGGEIGGGGLRGHLAAACAQLYGGARGTPGIGAEVGQAARHQYRRPLQAGAARHRYRRPSWGATNTPDVAPVDITLVRRVDNLVRVLGMRNVLHFELAPPERTEER